MKTSYKEKEPEIGTRKKTVTFEEPDQGWVESKNQEQKSWSGESDAEENGHLNKKKPEG